MTEQYTSAMTAVYNAARSKEEHKFLGGLALFFSHLDARFKGYTAAQVREQVDLAKADVAREIKKVA